MAELRKRREQHNTFPPVVFVFREPLAKGNRFFARFWPEATAVADPDGYLYDAFTVGYAGLLTGFGPAVWLRTIKLLLSGQGMGWPGADPMRMPSLFLVRKPEIVWTHHFRHVGDRPDYDKIKGLAESPFHRERQP